MGTLDPDAGIRQRVGLPTVWLRPVTQNAILAFSGTEYSYAAFSQENQAAHWGIG